MSTYPRSAATTMPLSLVEDPSAPRPKPRTATIVQAAGFVGAVAPAALIPLLLLRLSGLIDARRNWGQMGLDAGEFDTTPLDLARSEFAAEFAIVLALPVVLTLLALATAVGLQRRRRWARIFGAVWSGVLLLPVAAWTVGSIVLLLTVPAPISDDYDVATVDPFTLNAIASTAALVSLLLVFVLLLTRRVRRWTPRRIPPWAPAPTPPSP